MADTTVNETPAPSAAETRNAQDKDVAARYEAALAEVGRTFLSRHMRKHPPAENPADRRAAWVEDHQAYMEEMRHPVKVPKIGGALLDLYALFREVIERGGVQNVIEHREFKLIGRLLNLPQSCTSAAYVLRTAYVNNLYPYEQMLVFGRTLEASPRVVPLKESSSRHDPDLQPDSDGPVPSPPPNSLPSRSPSPSLSPSPATPSPSTPQTHLTRPLASPNPLTAPSKPIGRPPSSSPTPSSMRGGGSSTDPPRQKRPYVRRNFPASQGMGGPMYGSAGAGGLGGGLPGMPPPPPAIPESPTLSPSAVLAARKKVTAPVAIFNAEDSRARAQLVRALQSGVEEQVLWALGVLNALTFDVRKEFWVVYYPGVLEALGQILLDLEDDLRGRRLLGNFVEDEEATSKRPRVVMMAGLEFLDQRSRGRMLGGNVFFDEAETYDPALGRVPTLQRERSIFNAEDAVATERLRRASVASNILRNMSLIDKNGPPMAVHAPCVEVMWRLMSVTGVTSEIRDNLFDVWLNISVFLNVSSDSPCSFVLKALVGVLNPILPSSDDRPLRAVEIIGHLAANPDKNEEALTSHFDHVLPVVVDYLISKNTAYSSAAVTVLCNFSAFDWPARGKMAQTPRLVNRLVDLLLDTELAPRSALTLLNLSEAPNNRRILLQFEESLVQRAMEKSPAAETLASVLSELASD